MQYHTKIVTLLVAF